MFSSKKYICRACGTQGKPKKKVKGSIGMEIVLWGAALVGIVTILPVGFMIVCAAVVYSLWRASSASRVKVCPACEGEATMIPLETPEGTRLAAGGISRVPPITG